MEIYGRSKKSEDIGAKISKAAISRQNRKLAKGITIHESRPKKKDFEEMIYKFVSLHFQTDGKHNGNIIVQTKGIEHLADGAERTGEPDFKYVGFRQPDKLSDFLVNLRYAKENAYYITCNSFTKGARRKNNAFTFHNIVIDIDCHKLGMDQKELQRLLHLFVDCLETEFCHDYGIPVPNTAVYTGRGLQLWWSLIPISAACDKMYAYVSKYLTRQLERARLDHADLFGLFTIDMTASGNISGLYRIPMTLNQKTGSYGKIEFIHDKQLDLPTFCEEAHDSAVDNIPKYLRRPKTSDPKETADRRTAALFELVRMRVGSGNDMTGQRDLTLFFLYNINAQAYAPEEILPKIEKINKLFPDPLSEHKYLSYLSTSRRKEQGYLVTNATIIERLQITQKEQQHIRLFATAGQQREALRKEAKEIKTERDRRILELAKELSTKKEIAQRVGCSESTVANVLKKHGKKTAQEWKRRQACFALIKGKSVKEVAAKTGRSLKNIYELATMIAEKGFDTIVGKNHTPPLPEEHKSSKKENKWKEEDYEQDAY